MSSKCYYSYSSPTKEEREQIENIRKEYLEKTDREQKLELLKTMDRKVRKTPTLVSLSLGIVGTLIFGLGLTMVLEWSILFWGILVMILGLVPVFLAYPIFNKLKIKLKNKYAKDIVKLSNELLNEEKQ